MKKWEDKLDKIFEDNMIGYCSQIGGAEEIQIKELIEQELDKAREGGSYEKEEENRMLRFALRESKVEFLKMWSQEEFSDLWKKVGGISKLKQ